MSCELHRAHWHKPRGYSLLHTWDSTIIDQNIVMWYMTIHVLSKRAENVGTPADCTHVGTWAHLTRSSNFPRQLIFIKNKIHIVGQMQCAYEPHLTRGRSVCSLSSGVHRITWSSQHLQANSSAVSLLIALFLVCLCFLDPLFSFGK